MLPETVTVTDPAHQFYGLTLPLVRIIMQERVGRVCVVTLRPAAERRIPVAATDLGAVAALVSPCRLAVPAIAALLAVVASLPPLDEEVDEVEKEDAHGSIIAPGPADAAQPPTRATPGAAW